MQIAAGRGGRHVHLLSVRAQLGMRDRGYSSYCSSKGGLVLLVKQHAVELARHGITVNGVAPTVVRTRMATDWCRSRRSTAACSSAFRSGASPRSTTSSARCCSSCRAARRFVTGQILYVDGGITATQ